MLFQRLAKLKSTPYALIYILHCILEALDIGHCYARILFTDFNVLCTELSNLGVHINVLISWIGSFLTNRSQSVKISTAISGHVVPRGGIPQGTKLAPLLFAVLVNNLARQWKIRAKYVDDLSVVHSNKRFWKCLETKFYHQFLQYEINV